MKDFAGSFTKSDIILIADIYASAREKNTLGVTSATLVEEIALNKKVVQYIKNYNGLIKFIEKSGEKGDIYVLMGAGDIYEWGKKLSDYFSQRV
jgi:UDP-N-acetylmuramate--alanine ligase